MFLFLPLLLLRALFQQTHGLLPVFLGLLLLLLQGHEDFVDLGVLTVLL